MRAYKVILECEITYIENGRDLGFPLEVDNIIVIDSGFMVLSDVSLSTNNQTNVIKYDILKEIYYNEYTVDYINKTKKCEFAHMDKINTINPLIHSYTTYYNKYTAEYCPYLIDITIEWRRDNILEELLK